ncbi:MAG: aldo/keto reductase, partial [Saprospiraceae bacterium]|nr:aldo/keto reductase [Saprospiraceae bacterium]
MKNISRREATKLIALGASASLLSSTLPFIANKKMNLRTIPSTKEKIPCIGLGTWQTFDVGRSESEREPLKEVLNTLVQYGGSVIDSSPMYGRSEQVVGELTTELGLKGKLFEATKVWTTGQSKGKEQIDRSMRLMNANPMDLLQIHNLLDWKTHIKTLRDLKEEGKVRYIGITHYHQGGYTEMVRIMKDEPIDFIQINYNLAVRDAAERILPLAKEKGLAVLINRPYEGGSLFRKFKGTDLPEWAAEFEAKSWGQFFLKFILANEAVTCVIPGTSKAKHMADNAQAGIGALPSDG